MVDEKREPDSMGAFGSKSCLRNLERTRRLSKVLAKVGSTRYKVRLFPLLHESVYICKLVDEYLKYFPKEAPDLGDCKDCFSDSVPKSETTLFVDLSNLPGGPPIFDIILDYCHRSLFNQHETSRSICVSNVMNLIAASELLEIPTLKTMAHKFIDDNLFFCWKSCADVREIEGNGVVPEGNYTDLLKECEESFFRTARAKIQGYVNAHDWVTLYCNVSCLLPVADILPRHLAERVYERIMEEKLGIGLFVSSNNGSAVHTVHIRDFGSNFILYASRYEQKFVSARLPKCVFGSHYYNSSKDCISKTSIVMAAKLPGCDEVNTVRWLKDLRNELPDLAKRSLLLVHLARLMRRESDLSMTTVIPSELVVTFLIELTEICSEVKQNNPKDEIVDDLAKEIYSLEKLIGLNLEKMYSVDLRGCKYSTLVSVVSNFTRRIRDCNTQNLWYKGTLEATEKSIEVIDECLSSQMKTGTFTFQQVLSIYLQLDKVFKDVSGSKVMSEKNVIEMNKILDFSKLFGEIVERLFGELDIESLFEELGADCDSRSMKRLVKKIMEVQEFKDERYKLTCSEQAAEIALLRQEDDDRTMELMKLRQECAQLRVNLAAANQEVDTMRGDLDDEIDKTSCQICFERQRDTVCLPCMHWHYCSECLNKHKRRSNTCPTCRSSTTGVLTLHP